MEQYIYFMPVFTILFVLVLAAAMNELSDPLLEEVDDAAAQDVEDMTERFLSYMGELTCLKKQPLFILQSRQSGLYALPLAQISRTKDGQSSKNTAHGSVKSRKDPDTLPRLIYLSNYRFEKHPFGSVSIVDEFNTPPNLK